MTVPSSKFSKCVSKASSTWKKEMMKTTKRKKMKKRRRVKRRVVKKAEVIPQHLISLLYRRSHLEKNLKKPRPCKRRSN